MPNATKRTPAARDAASVSKAPAAKKAAPAKKTAPAAKAAAPRKAAAAATAETPAPPTEAPPGSILFRGRIMKVHKLSAEQIGVWRRMAKRFVGFREQLAAGTVDADRVYRALDQVLEIVVSALADEADQDWVEAELLARRMDLNDAAEIISLAVQSFVDGAGKGRPSKGPAPRARRAR